MKKKHAPGCGSNNCCDPCTEVQVSSWSSDVTITEGGASGALARSWTNGYIEPTQHVSSSTHEAYSFKVKLQSTANITIDCEGVSIVVDFANQTINIGSDTVKVAGSNAADDPIWIQVYACPDYVYVNAWNWETRWSYTDFPSYEGKVRNAQRGFTGTCLISEHGSPQTLTPRTRFTTTGTGTITPFYEGGTPTEDIPASAIYAYVIIPETRTFDGGGEPDVACGNGPDKLWSHYDHLKLVENGTYTVSGFEIDWTCDNYNYEGVDTHFAGFRRANAASWTPKDYFSRFQPASPYATSADYSEEVEPLPDSVLSIPENQPFFNSTSRLIGTYTLCHDVDNGGGTLHTGTNDTDDTSTQVSTTIELLSVGDAPFDIEWSVTWTPADASNTLAEIEAPSGETYSLWAVSDLTGSVARTDTGTISGANPATESGDWIISIFDTNADDITLDTWTITIDLRETTQVCGGLPLSIGDIGGGWPETMHALGLRMDVVWSRDEPSAATPYPVPTYEVKHHVWNRGGCCYHDTNKGRIVCPRLWEGTGTGTTSIDINDLKDGYTLAVATSTYTTCGSYTVPTFFVWDTPQGTVTLEPNLIYQVDPPCDTTNDPQGSTTTVTVTL